MHARHQLKQASKHHKQKRMSLVATQAIVDLIVGKDAAPKTIVIAVVLVVRQGSQCDQAPSLPCAAGFCC